MTQALFYKEWIKTRRSVYLIAAIMAALVAYAMINASQAFRVSGAVQVWNAVITKDAALLPSFMQWLPALAGLLLALAQFIPEMADKRLKLTLHLPVAENRIVSATLLYGAIVLSAVFILTYAALITGFSAYYPAEMITAMVWQSLPWFIAGWCVYLLAAWICMEPVWRYKISGGLAALCLLSFFYIDAAPGAYRPFIPFLIALTVSCFAFPFFSVARFKEGAQ